MPTIRQLRLAKGFTQLELANRLNVTPSTIQNWERGRHRPLGRKLRTLAEVFQVAVEEIEQDASSSQSSDITE